MSDILIILWLLVGIAIAIPFYVRRLAAQDKHFTFPLSNHSKVIERGGAKDEQGIWRGGIFHGLISEVPGYVVVKEGYKVYKLKSETKLTAKDRENIVKISVLNQFLRATIGVHFYGIYPFYHIKNFPITRAYENLKGEGPENWVNVKDTIIANALRFTFPRPYVFTNVELGDNTKVNIKIVLKLRVLEPYIPLYHFTDDFFTQTGSVLQSEVIDDLKNFATIDDFRASKKGETAGFLRPYIQTRVDADGNSIESPQNEVLSRDVGLLITSIAINDWQSATVEVDRAIERKAIAVAEGNASIAAAEKKKEVTQINAEAYKIRVRLETEADVQRQKDLAESQSAFIRRTREALVVPGTDPNVAAQTTGNIIEAQALSGKDSKVQTLVQRGSGQPPSLALPLQPGAPTPPSDEPTSGSEETADQTPATPPPAPATPENQPPPSQPNRPNTPRRRR